MRKPSNIIKHELIGLELRVARSRNQQLIGTEGKIVNETRNMLTIITKKGEKKLTKTGNTFEISLPGAKAVEIEGKLLVGRPEMRLKASLPKKRL
jgi:ribonuclease P protein subunit POP4